MSEATAKSGPRKPPITAVGPIAWAKANLFSGWLSTAVTLAMGYLVIRLGLSFIDWAFVKAIWSVPMGPTGAQTQSCRDLQGAGACWAVIADKHRFMLFGTYPYEQHWRPALACVLFVILYVISAMRRFWRWELALIWVAMLTAIGILMWGGVFGLSYVPQERWGGCRLPSSWPPLAWPSPFPWRSWWHSGGVLRCRPSRRSACFMWN